MGIWDSKAISPPLLRLSLTHMYYYCDTSVMRFIYDGRCAMCEKLQTLLMSKDQDLAHSHSILRAREEELSNLLPLAMRLAIPA